MDFKKLLENKAALAGIIGVLVLIFVVVMMLSLGASNKDGKLEKEKVYKEPMTLLSTKNIGKAIEIQALLAKKGIRARRLEDGTKSKLVLAEYTLSQRDMALLAIVQSGLVDQNIGLEIFDKGDFTSTKDDKRIRLARAINGELSRLIRKIPPIENASVFISIETEPTIFTSMKKPTSATVQLAIPTGDVLPKDKIRAITNLLLGSVQGLKSENISITDTNGHVYSSIIGSDEDMLSIVEENDQYMKRKIQSQLDRLVGAGKYVVTVSTHLRQYPTEKNSIVYDPKKNTVISAQKFSEKLGDKSADKGTAAAISTYVPNGTGANSSSSSQNRNYIRSAEEMQFGASRTQLSEYYRAGMIEEISIAVTLENGSMPVNMTIPQLKELVAKSASPKVNTDNVEIAFSEAISPYLASERPSKLPAPENSGNPWWSIIVLLIVGLIAGLAFIASRVKAASKKQKREMEALREKTAMQENQLKEVHKRASLLLAQQEQIQQSIVANQQQQQAVPLTSDLQETISNVKDSMDDSEDVSIHLKHWIESN